jgi:hypothetical protein
MAMACSSALSHQHVEPVACLVGGDVLEWWSPGCSGAVKNADCADEKTVEKDQVVVGLAKKLVDVHGVMSDMEGCQRRQNPHALGHI